MPECSIAALAFQGGCLRTSKGEFATSECVQLATALAPGAKEVALSLGEWEPPAGKEVALPPEPTPKPTPTPTLATATPHAFSEYSL